ncbi:MAG TPA: glycosyltransferase family 1 protein [Planctomycetia bacterium]|nr:glycosyltransferase family 1 protein [Planctomycetia bacterium]
MARILVHALAATAGGGANYLRNFLARVGACGATHEWLVLAPAELEGVAETPHVRILRGGAGRGAVRRVYYDQIRLRQVIREEEIELILATGNFGMLRPPVPQVLLNRNALYFSREHLWELRRRGEFRELLNTMMRRRLALASIAGSACNVVPTHSFMQDVRASLPRLSGDRFETIPHGFDRAKFARPGATLAPEIASKLRREPGLRRILMVSHYNYFRNFETLLRAVAVLRERLKQPIELVLTTKLGKGVKDHRYDTSEAARLVEEAKLENVVTMLGAVPHGELYPLYRSADVVVCPSYAESFGHPMVEAMASGRPIVASDRGVQREMCGDAAVYFSVFDPQHLASRLEQVLGDEALAKRLATNGERRADDFSWEKHFDGLLETIGRTLVASRPRVAA